MSAPPSFFRPWSRAESPRLIPHRAPAATSLLWPQCLQRQILGLSMTMIASEDRLAACWRIQSCDGCVNSRYGCGWCPVSAICIPASSLLEPVVDNNICPYPEERFELRTRALGCKCSTTTFISVVVSVFVTIATLFVFYILGFGILRLNHSFGTGAWRGTELKIENGQVRQEEEWRRGTWFG